MVFLAVCSQRELGARGRLPVGLGSLRCDQILGKDPCLDSGVRMFFQFGIISATACRTLECC